MQAKVSIIVPVYNAAQHIDRCIHSILNQSYSDIELLLINDGSKDESGKICDNHAVKDARIKVFHQQNAGVSCARNKGLDECSGTYVLFVDSDDYLEKDCLEKLLTGPIADLTYMSSNVHYDTEDYTSYHLRPLYLTQRSEIEKEILHLKANPQNYLYFGYTWNKLFKASIIKQHNIRFVRGLHFYEDDVFTLEYCRYIQSLRTIPDCLYNYTVSWTGLTAAANSCEEFELLIDANTRNIQFFKDQELYKHEISRIWGFLLQAIRQAQRQKRKDMYKHLTLKAHQFYLKYIRPNNIYIRKTYRKKNFCLFKLSISLHKR